MSMLVYTDAHEDVHVHVQVCGDMDVEVDVAADVEKVHKYIFLLMQMSVKIFVGMWMLM